MRLLQLAFTVALASGVAAILIYITGVSTLNGTFHVSDEDLEALQSLQLDFQKCVRSNGLGLQAVSGRDYCQVTMKFPSDTIPKWKDPKTGELEGLSFEFNLCEAIATWEQVRNSTTVLTREFIDALPNGWEDYAWRRINKGIHLNRCENRTLCMEKLSLVLSETPPYVPRQFARCAVIGNSGDLLKTKFGKEIDGYDAVLRENGAPIQNYTEYVGTKSTFRLLNRGSAKALDKVAELYEAGKEVLLVKTTIHDIMNKMIREIPILNPIYLMLGASFGSAAKGTGLKALEYALSICDSVDMYGFTVDPGYKEWTRYFSESRQGHTPLHGRAYYQMMECLGLIKIHSPLRADPNRVVKWLPSHDTVKAARIASEKLLRVGAGSDDPLGACSITKKQIQTKFTGVSGLRKAAVEHQKYVKGATMYPLEHNPGVSLFRATVTNQGLFPLERYLSFELGNLKMALGMRCGSIEKAENGELGFVTRTRSFGRKRIVLTNDMFVYYDCGVKTPAKKHCVENLDFGQEKSVLEALPQDILIRVLCGVDHDDLKRLFHVSKSIRDATLIAKKWHFAYSTPKKVLPFRNSIDFEDAVEFDEIEAPNAPKQNRVPRSRLSKKKLGDISVALFAAEDDKGGWPRRDLFMEMATEI